MNRLGKGCKSLQECQISPLPTPLRVEARPAAAWRGQDVGQSRALAACSRAVHDVRFQVIRCLGFLCRMQKNFLEQPQEVEMTVRSSRGAGCMYSASLTAALSSGP